MTLNNSQRFLLKLAHLCVRTRELKHVTKEQSEMIALKLYKKMRKNFQYFPTHSRVVLFDLYWAIGNKYGLTCVGCGLNQAFYHGWEPELGFLASGIYRLCMKLADEYEKEEAKRIEEHVAIFRSRPKNYSAWKTRMNRFQAVSMCRNCHSSFRQSMHAAEKRFVKLYKRFPEPHTDDRKQIVLEWLSKNLKRMAEKEMIRI